jgi:type IV pilus assembly protein PilP
MMNVRSITLAVVAPLLLSACVSEEHQDLKLWMQESSVGIKGRVVPLPEIKPFPVVSYDADSYSDPFAPERIEPEKKNAGGGGFAPDLNRYKEPLEAYPLESLKMVGVLREKKGMSAIIQADKTVHTVRPGNYIGQNFGKIAMITETEISIVELVQDPANDWVERPTSLQLLEQETKK